MKHTLTLTFISVICTIGRGQQTDVPVLQFQHTLIQTNPATTGLICKKALNALYHQNRIYGDYDVSANLNYAFRPDSAKYGIGVSYVYDNWYTSARTQVLLMHYARHFRLGKESVLSFGISGGLRSEKFNYFWIASNSPSDPLLPDNEKQRRWQWNAGLAFHSRNLNVGFSVTQLNSPKYQIGKNSYLIAKPNYWFFADYTIVLPARFELKPQLQIVTDATKIRPYASLIATYNKRVWAGGIYAPEVYTGGMAGIDIYKKYRIGFMYGTYKNKAHYKHTGKMFEVLLAFFIK